MASDTGEFQWEALKPMPTKRVFSTPVECNDKLYLVGGCDQRGTPLDSFEVYSPDKQQWQRLQQVRFALVTFTAPFLRHDCRKTHYKECWKAR